MFSNVLASVKIVQNHHIFFFWSAVAAFSVFYSLNYAGEKKKNEPVELSEGETQQILHTFLSKLREGCSKFFSAFEQIKQQVAQQGQQIPDRTIMEQAIFPHFSATFQEIKDAVLNEAGIDEKTLEIATEHYKTSNLSIAEIVQKVKVIYYEFGGDVDGNLAQSNTSSTSYM